MVCSLAGALPLGSPEVLPPAGAGLYATGPGLFSLSEEDPFTLSPEALAPFAGVAAVWCPDSFCVVVAAEEEDASGEGD